jgi:prepilin-type N-terminal cleavage/methylation domain-containing protein
MSRPGYSLDMNRSGGFTLIELLVVTSIISFLASMIISSATAARIRAQNTTAMSFLHSFNQVMESYYIDNNRYPDDNCPGGNPCTICKDIADSNWPPTDLVNYSLKIPTTVPSFAHTLGCGIYSDVAASFNTYRFDFYLRGNSDEEATNMSEQLKQIFDISTNPCVWYDIDLISCHVQVIR